MSQQFVGNHCAGGSARACREHWGQVATIPPPPSPSRKSSLWYWSRFFLKETRDRFFLLSMPGCKGTDAKGHFCFSPGDWSSSLRGIDQPEITSLILLCDLRWTCMARRRLRCRSPRWTGSPHARWRPARTKKSKSASGRKVRGSGRDHPDPVGRGQVNHHHRTCSGPQHSLPSRSLTFLSCFDMVF